MECKEVRRVACGSAVAQWLGRSSLAQWGLKSLAQNSFKNPAVNEYPNLIGVEEAEGSRLNSQ